MEESGSRRQPTSGRDLLIEAALEEITQHGPKAMMHSVRRWSSGCLSMVNLHVLMVLAHEGAQPMHAIADSLDVSQASTTGIIDRMEELGYVARERDASDRRVVNVTITDAGRDLIAGIATERRERLATQLAEMSDDDLAALTQGLRALRAVRERQAEAHGVAPEQGHGEPGHAQDSPGGLGREAEPENAS
jgi:DNA-binding MarR family transcriptional regulator